VSFAIIFNLIDNGIFDHLSIYISVEKIANKRGISMAQVALAWILSKDHVTAPIIGTTSLANLRDCIGTFPVFFFYLLNIYHESFCRGCERQAYRRRN
jgi:predicted oxidoreductase